MSIYATLWVVKFPRYGDYHTGCEWVEVIGQGAPAHIGTPSPGHGYESGDPYADFLPPAVPIAEDYDGAALRAVVVVRDGTPKVRQRYADPLLVLSADGYAATPFEQLHRRICDALRGGRPRCVLEYRDAAGRTFLMFEDKSVREVDPSGSG